MRNGKLYDPVAQMSEFQIVPPFRCSIIQQVFQYSVFLGVALAKTHMPTLHEMNLCTE